MAFICLKEFPGKGAHHSFEQQLKVFRDAGLLEYRVDEEVTEKTAYYDRLPADQWRAPNKREGMCHWWTDKGWMARDLLLEEADTVLVAAEKS